MTPEFNSAKFLNSHIRFILDFYDERVVAPAGGFFQCFRDDGSVYDLDTRHLVSSTRFVYNYATAYRLYGEEKHRQWASHGLDFLTAVHRQAGGHYAWEVSVPTALAEQLSEPQPAKTTDGRAMAYGHAFVILAAASCIQAGIEGARPVLDEAWTLLETHFWDQDQLAYSDERDGSLQTLDPYRGQNANMHACEACIAAHIATGELHYLDRAVILAERFAFELASGEQRLIWEHYNTHWQPDMQYNIDKPDDLFKPWGYQPGHQVEWTKLLLQLNELKPDLKWVTRAAELFNAAITHGWDQEHGGVVYGFAPDLTFSDSHKYFWVHAEAFAAAWRLYEVTGEERYLADYNRIWDWSWRHLIDHKEGAWFRIRNRDGSEFDKLKSPPGKTDYHTLGACWDVLANPSRLID